MSTRFTILLPITRPPVFLPFAVETVLAQSITEFQLFVVCDGAPAETVACAEAYARRDGRVRVFSHPKGERHGEAYRHSALAEASGRYVAYICDDDLWFPNHLEEMAVLLSSADFGNLLHVSVRSNGHIEILPGNLGLPETRARMLTEAFNLFGPTFAGHRMDAYRCLPEGWAPGPADTWTDLNMWRKFLRVDSFTFATRVAVTGVHFATTERLDVTPEERQDEIRAYFERIRNPRARNEIIEAAWRTLFERALHTEGQLRALTTDHAAVTAARDELRAEVGRMTLSRDALYEGLGQVVVSRDAVRAELLRAVESGDALRADLARTAACRDADQAELSRAVASRDKLQAEYARVMAQLDIKDRDLDIIFRSRSWRMTAALRGLMMLVRRLGRTGDGRHNH